MSGPSPSPNTPADPIPSSPIPSIKLIRHAATDTDKHERRDVEAETDELMSDDEEQTKTPSGIEILPCRWGKCTSGFVEQDKLVHHLHSDHIGVGKDHYVCDWSDCVRKGQRQATRHSLITHCRAHTGERPYTCTQLGCGRTFTRSDAMNKHLRSLHGIFSEPLNKKRLRDPQSALTQRPLLAVDKFEWTPSSDADLVDDEDIGEVVRKVRKRETFWSTTEDDHRLVKLLRERHPRGRSRIKAGEKDDSDDSFDHGIGAGYAVEPAVERVVVDPDGEVEVLGRSRWQIRFIVAKAKLMLVDEENRMRRRELEDLMELERRMKVEEP